MSDSVNVSIGQPQINVTRSEQQINVGRTNQEVKVNTTQQSIVVQIVQHEIRVEMIGVGNSGSAGATAFADLTDVNLSSPQAGQILVFNEDSELVNHSPTTTDIAEGDNLYYTDNRAVSAVAAIYDPQNIVDDAFDRANHTGTQLASTISDLAEVATSGDHADLSNIGTNTHAQIDTFIASKGNANGLASLDSGGKVPFSQLPSSLMTYLGVWNASTNSPTLADGSGDAGDVYRVGTAGSQDLGSGSISFGVGDYVIYNGTTWEKSDTTDAVASVNGYTGVVSLTTGDIAEGGNLYFTDERAQDAVGAVFMDSSTVDFTYSDGTPSITASVIQSAIDHGSIGGLSDDDHTQYLLASAATDRATFATNWTDLTDGGDSSLHFHSADRDRANHTGTQTASTISDFAEVAQDSIGTILADSSEIDFTYDDATPSITASLKAGSIDEAKLDTSVNASLDLADSALQSGDNISELTNDSGFITNLSSFSTNDLAEGAYLYFTDERAQDAVGGVLVDGNGIDLTYNDATPSITAALTTLTSDWDIGENRSILAEFLKARDNEGLRLSDDGGNTYIQINDGGNVDIRRDSSGPILTIGTLTLTEGATTYNTGWYRGSVDNSVLLNVVRASAPSVFFGTGVNGDSFRRYVVTAGGTMNWGPGSADRDTNLYRSAADTLKTDDSLIVGTDLEIQGNVGIGTDTPQGRIHSHDGTGGFLYATKTNVVGSAQTFIPDGTGDVTAGITGFFVINNAGATANSFTLLPGDTLDVVVGTSTIRFAVSAAGAFTVIRQAGTDTGINVTVCATWQ